MKRICIYIALSLLASFLFRAEVSAQPTVSMKPGSGISISPGATFHVNGGLVNEGTITGNTGRLNITGDYTNSSVHNASSSTISIGGDFIDNATFNVGTCTLIMNGPASQTITGSATNSFYELSVNKTGGILYTDKELTITKYLRLLSSHKFDINDNDLIITSDAEIYSDNADGQYFHSDKYIVSSQATAASTSGYLIRQIAVGVPPSPDGISFVSPIGNSKGFGSAIIRFLPDKVTFAANADLRILPIPEEHPGVIISDRSLTKYWRLEHNNVTIADSGTNLKFYYDLSDSEVPSASSEGNYIPLLWQGSGWILKTGVNKNVNSTTNEILSEYSPLFSGSIEGEWTAGQIEAAVATYFSLGGDWSSNTSWSNIAYGGAAAANAPNLSSDNIRIGDNKTITINSTTNIAGTVRVQSTGRLDCVGEADLRAADFILEAEGTLGIGSADGITDINGANSTDGNIRSTNSRDFGPEAYYHYIGTLNQDIGLGLPLTVSKLVCEKTGGTLSLTRNTQISNSFHISGGTFDDNWGKLNGQTASRTFTMSGGTFIAHLRFPLNYEPPTFTAGTVSFRGNSDLYVPSSGSGSAVMAGVLQYHNLDIAGDRESTTSVSFSPLGEVKIGGALTINNLNWTTIFNNMDHIATKSSTIHFNGSANQNIPRNSNDAGSGVNYQLKYYNLKISGGGTKSLIEADCDVNNNVIIEGATLSANNFDMDVLGSWTNSGGTFDHDNQTVNLYTPSDGLENTITAGGSPFWNLEIGNTADEATGDYRLLDDMTTENVFHILNPKAELLMNSSTFTIKGTWVNDGTFTPGTGTVMFNGTAANQLITKTGTETFYNLKINNAGNVLVPNNCDIDVAHDLTIVTGNIDVRTNDQIISVYNDITSSGTGHVDGHLRFFVPAGAVRPKELHIGDGSDYSPVAIEFSGTDGTAGYLDIISNDPQTIGVPPDLNAAKYINRQWDMSVPAGSDFVIGSRTYNATLAYLTADIVGAAAPLLLETKIHDGTSWNSTQIGAKTTNTCQSLGNTVIGTFFLGEPDVFDLYSIADGGNWSDYNTWSIEGYGGNSVPASFPIDGNSQYYIGDGKTINLDADFTINAGNDIVVQVGGASNLAGSLDCSTNTIDGAGTFKLQSGSLLIIGSPDGIAASAATGNIQTTTREFNDGGHNLGKFIYNGSADQITGDGLPDVFSTLEIITSTNTVELSKNITVSDTLNISTGIFDVSTSNYSINVSGNWRNTGAFTERAGTVTFNGTDDQLLRNTSGETFYNLLINKTDGVLELDISSDIFVSNQLTLTAGIIDSRSNLRSVTILNGATVSRTSGHVDGEMKKYVPSGATASDIVYEIGEGLSYTPMDLGFVGTDGTTGYVSATSMPDKHANFGNASMDLASAAVVERHWDLSADAGFDLGTRTINATVTFLNPDDINGGADPDDFKMRYWDQSVWNSAIIGTKTSTTTQGTSISELSDIMVGPTGSLITYYTRQSGDWNDVATWSTVAYGGPQAGAFPDGNGSVVFIGDADTVNLDQSRSVRSVTVEEFSGGKGSLFLSDYVLSGAQFVLKNSGELGIGSADGIRSAAASGNIQTTVRNFNPSSHNSGHYIYNGTVNQNTGDALPANIATFEVDNSGNTVSLQSSISLSSDLTLTAGILRPTAAAIGIALAGDWINNSSASAYDANADKVTFFSASTSAIGGNYATTFYDVDMDKSSFNLVLGSNITVDNDFTFLSDGLLVLNSKDLTIGTSGSITGASLGSSRMVQSDGSTTSGRIIKMYSGSGMNSFTLPIGTGTDYNPAELNVDATFAAGSYAALRLVSAVHPSALTTEMLSKYWAVSSSGISNVQSATNLKYYYLGSDVNGTAADYIAARYTNDVWETNLGTSRDATSSPITVSGYTDALDGDWTAGEATSIYKGRIFYSIASGNWNNVTSWSNESHSGSASAYIPGTFEADTVFIDAADVIDYNLSSVTIGMLTIGGSETGSGELDFVRGSNKTMTILGDLKIESDGAMDQSGTGDRKDTLYLNGNLTNDNTGADAVDLRQGSANYTILAFTGLENSTIAGSGKYRLSGVHVAKEALSDTVYNLATEFSSALTTAVSGSDTDRPFKLETGVYCHDNSGYALLDVNGAPNTRFAMGLNSGLDIRQGECDFEDEFVTNTNTLVSISGGTMTVGNASNEDFLYGSGTKYTQSGGVVDVYGAFSVINATSLVDFNMSGGTLSVVMAENSNSDTDHIGFDIRSPSSTYTQSGGTVIIVTYSSSHDYQVKAGTVNVTGGTLQIGVVGTPFNSTGASIGVGNDRPTIWNLSVRSTMYNGDTYRSMIIVSSVLYVKNDVIIHPQGCLDLNTQSLSFGGDFINNGIFTTDGLGWNSGGGSREVIFNGTNDVTVSTEDPIATSPDNTRFRNEAFYDVTIDKPGGSITLGDLSNSDMLVRNYLTFTDVNVANIISRTNNRMVYIDWQATGDRATVQRHGLGFVDGRLRKEIPKDDSYTFFEIGAGSVYRPATLEMIGTGGGDMDPVDFINIPGEPANIASNGINLDLTRNIQSYWTFSDPGAFNLGGRTFDLTTQFAPADVRPGGSWTSLNQYYASSVPYSTTQIGLRTDTTTQSLSNSLLGNYMLGETIGFDYYSIASGDWNNKNTWSSVGYGGAPATEYPDGENDRVYIGDGYEVVLNKIVNSRSVLIEPSAGASGQPGSLYCKVDSWLNGSGFILEDGTTLSTEHPNGITATSESGSIRTTLRDYGYSHYKYTGKGQNQSTGSGLPYDIMSLTVDNTGVDGQNTVTLTDDLGIDQDLNILNGVFDTGSKDINMIGNVLMENRTTNKTEFEPKSGTVVFDGILNQTITVNDPGDLEFNRIMLNKTGGVLRMAGNDSGADLLVRNLLRYMADNTINVDVRTNNRKLLLQNENNATIENVGSGFVDGKMQMTVFPNADTIQYKIGYMSDYMPMTMTMVGNGGSQGPVTAIVNDLVATDEAVVSKQIDPVKSVPRYWMTEGIDSFSLGGRTIITLFEFPSVFLDNFEYSSSILRRKSIPAEDPLWSGIRGDYLTWNIAVASVTISDASKYWPGLGKMYVGEMATREFYSIDGGGLWNDPASWSFTGHGGAPASGEFPNKDWETEIDIDMRDIVYIGDNDEIVLNVLPEIAVLEIRGTGSLVIPDDSQYGSARFIIPSSFGTSSFEMFEDGLLVNKSESNLQSGTAGIIRFLDADRTYSPLADFEFSGAYNQYVGDAFPTEIGDLTINTDINSRIVSLLSGSLIINENLNVLSGDLRPQDATTNVRLGGSMTVNGSYNGTINPSGTSILSTFTFQGDGAADQVVSGTGNLLFADVTMNRGTGAGAVDLQTEMTITHVMDLREGTNANNQIFSVGDNQQLWITGTDVDAIIDYGDNTSKRMIRTAVSTGSTSTVGLLMRSVTQPQAQDYVFPVGSYSTESGEDTYSPAQFSAENSGGSGYIGLRVSRGSGINYNHARLSTVSPNYLQRYWTIDEVTTTIPGQWRFLYNDSDIFGNETDIGVIGRYNPAYEAAGGSWTTISGVITRASNYFETPTGYLATDFTGDYTISNLINFGVFFYSRQSGPWNDPNTWTYSPTHSGAAADTYPQIASDNVIIGGGFYDIDQADHIVSFVENINSVGDVLVGTALNNTGTLNCANYSLQGSLFEISDHSTLQIGASDGIFEVADQGNIRTTTRIYDSEAIYEYKGIATSDQAMGDGMPASVFGFIANHQDATHNFSLVLDRDVQVTKFLELKGGRVDAGNHYEMLNFATVPADGQFIIQDGAVLAIGGTRIFDGSSANSVTKDFVKTIVGYAIAPNSTVEYYNIHTITPAPNDGVGYGNVELTGTADCIITQSVLCRGNFSILGSSTINNINNLKVLKEVINESSIENNGLIEIGE